MLIGLADTLKFLDKPVPSEPFPRVNDAAGFDAREKQWHKANSAALMTNVGIIMSLFAVGVAAVSYRRSGRMFDFTTHAVDVLKGAIGRS